MVRGGWRGGWGRGVVQRTEGRVVRGGWRGGWGRGVVLGPCCDGRGWRGGWGRGVVQRTEGGVMRGGWRGGWGRGVVLGAVLAPYSAAAERLYRAARRERCSEGCSSDCQGRGTGRHAPSISPSTPYPPPASHCQGRGPRGIRPLHPPLLRRYRNHFFATIIRHTAQWPYGDD